MAFAHAVAAVFHILVSFAECLGASRLMDACSWFIDLWKGKHETGRWLEIEATEAMSNRSDFSAMNASGIMLSSMANKQNESHGDLASEDNGKVAIDASAGDKTVTDANEERAIVLCKEGNSNAIAVCVPMDMAPKLFA
ncbi:COP1-interacting protein 7 [Camellia lanceoleosa]|uniref:COP1-interacting protein 7 n=1 Tax=Camellia lanceoleosa TaxID=1840588 RepID=A0ACC0GVL7_9ERIC|nr:COP1-interacting protein 7 [Camellia lanceoleosa]